MARKSIWKEIINIKKTYQEIRRKIKRGMLRKKNYIRYREQYPLDEKAILLESQHGGIVGGNIFAIMNELCNNPEYQDYTIYLACFESRLESRYELLRQQFGYEEWDFAFIWNDPLYYYGW